MPYLTRDGHTTSLLFATGPNVTVNAILGLPFIKATSMIIDTNDNTIEMKALSCALFPIDFRRAQNTIPPPDNAASPSAARARNQYSSVIADIERLESYFATALMANATSASPRQVSFDLDTTTSGQNGRHMRWGITPPSANPVDISDALSGGSAGV